MIVNSCLGTDILGNKIDGKYWSVGYCKELDRYLLLIYVAWIASYERCYLISKQDYELCKTDIEKFEDKYKSEISQNGKICFTKNFIGAGALRDYDGANKFQSVIGSTSVINCFQHFNFYNDVLYARIITKDKDRVLLVPPLQAIQTEKGYDFPLRKTAFLYQDICYGIWEDFILKCNSESCRGREFYFDNSKIPPNEKYETLCPYCKSLLIRKKI
ncbi:MAG: hypothetical protein BWY78_01145 [Alphaproteobacteria bacterium ADurb.Bin438]|nr:MAG: hypothetical protein BWY78_01145 [Alphaproteobacteria bacterium ADurb.Bin438]